MKRTLFHGGIHIQHYTVEVNNRTQCGAGKFARELYIENEMISAIKRKHTKMVFKQLATISLTHWFCCWKANERLFSRYNSSKRSSVCSSVCRQKFAKVGFRHRLSLNGAQGNGDGTRCIKLTIFYRNKMNMAPSATQHWIYHLGTVNFWIYVFCSWAELKETTT